MGFGSREQGARRGFYAVLLAATLVFGAAAPRVVAKDWTELVREEATHRPEIHAQDVYKLVFQGTQGAEHAAMDPNAIEAALVREMETMGSDQGLDAPVPLVEPVSPDGVLVRVNLRPYKNGGGSARELAQAFMETARTFRRDSGRLTAVLQDLVRAKLGNAELEADLRRFVKLASDLGYPPMSHSDDYREAYLPAYRVVLAQLVPKIREEAATVRPEPTEVPASTAIPTAVLTPTVIQAEPEVPSPTEAPSTEVPTPTEPASTPADGTPQPAPTEPSRR